MARDEAGKAAKPRTTAAEAATTEAAPAKGARKSAAPRTAAAPKTPTVSKTATAAKAAAATKKRAAGTGAATRKPAATDEAAAGAPKLLTGGNPQIAKGYGDEPVAAYIAAMPGWKSEAGRRLDALIVATVPGVTKAVKWNSPLYGIEGQGWFLGVHCFSKYIKVAFFRGGALDPPPPVTSKSGEARYFHLHEGEFEGGAFDEARLAGWIAQASKLPGEKM